ncbi:hypothetical protein QE152_g13903 [Popillia japonica]|uniref:Uncharacterized protein n=1 Tax=Popillia japonica TaxID=7064 RepID=A0AAW1LBN8_POPJA
MEDATDTNENQLWFNLSALAESNLSGVLPRLIQEMLSSGSPYFNDDENFEITLPSDFEWRTKIYYKLLERQRMSQMS